MRFVASLHCSIFELIMKIMYFVEKHKYFFNIFIAQIAIFAVNY